MFGGRATTSPSTTTTVSAPSEPARAQTSAGDHAGPTAACTRPARSRRSRNTIPPRSRRRCTQPPSCTRWPTCSARSAPHRCVRQAVRLTPSSLLRLAQRAVEFLRRARLPEPGAHPFLPDQSRNPAQRPHVQPGERFPPGPEKKQPPPPALHPFLRPRRPRIRLGERSSERRTNEAQVV